MSIHTSDFRLPASDLALSSRRRFLQTTSSGFGYLAFSALSTWAAEQGAGSGASPLSPKQPHFSPRAKRVIFLSMRGGPSHVDTFDYKPELIKHDGKESGRGRGANATLLKPQWAFKQHGRSGLWISELFPNLAQHADELCLLRSMQTDVPNHPQAFVQMHTGTSRFTRPSLGAWTLYGLGTENQNLPGFITIDPPPIGGAISYGSSFLPAIYQGTKIGGNGLPPRGRWPPAPRHGRWRAANDKQHHQSTLHHRGRAHPAQLHPDAQQIKDAAGRRL